MLTAITGLASGGLMLLFSKLRKLFSQNNNDNMNVVSFNYIYEHSLQRSFCIIIGVLLSIYSFFYFSTEDMAVIIIFILILYIIYPFVTLWRIKKRFFGTNALEAKQLIEYMASHSKRGKGPPGNKVILSENEIISSFYKRVDNQAKKLGYS
jgi:hypothetical protein